MAHSHLSIYFANMFQVTIVSSSTGTLSPEQAQTRVSNRVTSLSMGAGNKKERWLDGSHGSDYLPRYPDSFQGLLLHSWNLDSTRDMQFGKVRVPVGGQVGRPRLPAGVPR